MKRRSQGLQELALRWYRLWERGSSLLSLGRRNYTISLHTMCSDQVLDCFDSAGTLLAQLRSSLHRPCLVAARSLPKTNGVCAADSMYRSLKLGRLRLAGSTFDHGSAVSRGQKKTRQTRRKKKKLRAFTVADSPSCRAQNPPASLGRLSSTLRTILGVHSLAIHPLVSFNRRGAVQRAWRLAQHPGETVGRNEWYGK
jgi:hypothetical protein